MKKILEDYLWSTLRDPSDKEKWFSISNIPPRYIIAEMLKNGWINSPKQAYATLRKWEGKGIYEYGSCLDLGWKCEKKISPPND